MITQRAKLRRLAFIRLVPRERDAHPIDRDSDTASAHPQGAIYVPAPAPAKGRHPAIQSEFERSYRDLPRSGGSCRHVVKAFSPPAGRAAAARARPPMIRL